LGPLPGRSSFKCTSRLVPKKVAGGRFKEEEMQRGGAHPADDSLNSKPRTYRIHVNLDTRIFFLKTCTKEFMSVCL